MSIEKSTLFLGSDNNPVATWLIQQGEWVISTEAAIQPQFIVDQNIGFVVSFGYRHIITQAVLEAINYQAINLHISYLPWNRGADPNFWSFVNNTPKGVTIHYINAGIDSGDIIVQKEIDFPPHCRTLSLTYNYLQAEIVELFQQHWLSIKRGDCPRRVQHGEGSFHTKKSFERYKDRLIHGWDTPVSELVSLLDRDNPSSSDNRR